MFCPILRFRDFAFKLEHTHANTNAARPLLKGATHIHAIGLQAFNNKKKPSIQKFMYMVTY